MEKLFSFLSKEYDNLFVENIELFYKDNSIKNNYLDHEFSLFYPSFGTDKKEEIDFIIYGQATNGWLPKFSLSPKIDFKKLLNEAKEYSNTIDESNPLDWVNINWSKTTKEEFINKNVIIDYNVSKSFFWNVAYKLISDYYKIDRNSSKWSGKLAWSNLMKISPAERGNPDEPMKSAQIEGCRKLFFKELEEIQPKYAILLTNLSWAEGFINEIKKINFRENSIIEWAGKYEKTLIIVTKRPFQGDSDYYAKEILEFIHKNS
jgi:hypothetical protein